MDFNKLVSEQQDRWRPHAKAFADATPQAVESWRLHVHAVVERRESHRKEVTLHEKNGMQPFIESLAGDERHLEGLEHFRRGASPHFSH